MGKDHITRLAVVGIGDFGLRYIQSLQTFPNVEVTWISSRTPANCEKIATQFGIPNYSSDIEELCADPDLDAVVVCTPEPAHCHIAVAALEAGKHAIVEKPLATREEDGLAMVEAEKQSGKRILNAFLLRFDYRYAQLKQKLDQIEPVRYLYAYRNFDRSLFARYSRTHSFIENAIHDIDLILWYTAGRVKKVHGFCRNTMARENPDINTGILEFEDGALATITTCWLYPEQRHDILQWNAGIQVMGDRGVLEVANDRGGFRGNLADEGIVYLDQTGWSDIHNEPRGAFGAMLRHFLAVIAGRAEYAGTTTEEAVESMRIACRLIEDSRKLERAP